MLILDQCILLASPKTGSKWCHAALKASVACDVEEFEGERHYHKTAHEIDLRGNSSRNSLFHRSNCLAFVRHPLPWYQSYWNHRMRLGWKMDKRLDRECAADDFETFLGNVIRVFPGYLSKSIRLWVGTEENPVGFIGKYEHLRDDLAWAMKHFGVAFDEQVLRETPKQNVGNYLLHPATCSAELESRLLTSEAEMIQRFYS